MRSLCARMATRASREIEVQRLSKVRRSGLLAIEHNANLIGCSLVVLVGLGSSTRAAQGKAMTAIVWQDCSQEASM